MDKEYDIEIHEINEEELSVSVCFEGFYLDIEAGIEVDEVDNLWGDQVSSISMMAQFDGRVYKVEQYDENSGDKIPYVDLDLFNRAKKVLHKEIYEEVDEITCKVNYSAYYNYR